MKKILTFILCFIFIACVFSFAGCGFTWNENYENSENYKIGNFTYSANEIEKVKVFWSSGSLQITTKEGETLSVAENSDNLSDSKKMHYLIENKTLTIHFCKSGYKGSIDNSQKVLKLEIPKNIDLKIDMQSGDMNIDTIETKNAEISSKSGSITANTISASELSIDNNSGSIKANNINIIGSCSCENLSGSIEIDSIVAENVSLENSSGKITVNNINAGNDLEAETQSGNISIANIKTKKLEIETKSGSSTLSIIDCANGKVESLSGNIDLNLLSGFGAKIKASLSSGNFSTSLQYVQDNDYKIFNNGTCLMNLSTQSGNIKIS